MNRWNARDKVKWRSCISFCYAAFLYTKKKWNNYPCFGQSLVRNTVLNIMLSNLILASSSSWKTKAQTMQSPDLISVGLCWPVSLGSLLQNNNKAWSREYKSHKASLHCNFAIRNLVIIHPQYGITLHIIRNAIRIIAKHHHLLCINRNKLIPFLSIHEDLRSLIVRPLLSFESFSFPTLPTITLENMLRI